MSSPDSPRPVIAGRPGGPGPWRAADYDALPLPHVAWAEGVLGRLGPVGGVGPAAPRVLDAGCGTGRDLQRVLQGQPGLHGIGIDADEAMLARARQRLAPLAGRCAFVRADLGRPLPGAATAHAPVDALMSVAAFHWVADTAALAGNLAALLRPGGRLVAECGGAGQLAAVEVAASEAGLGADTATTFRDPTTWAEALAVAGFDVSGVRLRPHPVRIDDLDVLARYLAVVVLRPHLAPLQAVDREAAAREVAGRLPGRTIDYVRLEVEATRV